MRLSAEQTASLVAEAELMMSRVIAIFSRHTAVLAKLSAAPLTPSSRYGDTLLACTPDLCLP